ncbi:hypothetical protein H4R18_001391 [Coemansia javaensis]|uniref:EF-hand domain-containing protein n=1 Tax=Coemansia javaensis TaxID=2761396 RepID=A0A9W8LKR0_9FUNG|nr:hypothetical protein H4R18_001391 [Coemansia javaensis]
MAAVAFSEPAGGDRGRGPAVINVGSDDPHRPQLAYSGSTLSTPLPDIPSALHDDFNWDRTSEDGDGDEDAKDEGAREVTGFWRMHPLVRALCIIFGGGIVLITPTIGVLASHRRLPFRATLDPAAPDYQKNYNLQCVARSFALLTALWVVGVFFYHMVDMVPDGVLRVWRMFKGKRKIEKLKDRLQFFIAIKLYVKLIVISAASLVCFVIMFPNASYKFTGTVEAGHVSWDQVLFQINVALLFASVVIAIEKLMLKVIATRFHRSVYKERLEQQQYASWVLDHLNRAREQPGGGDAKGAEQRGGSLFGSGLFHGNTLPHSDPNSSQRELLDEKGGARDVEEQLGTPPPLRERSSSSFWRRKMSGGAGTGAGGHSKKPSKSLANRLWNIRDIAMDGGIDMNSNQYAGRLARKLFNALHSDRDYLVVDDFLPFFDKEEDAIKAFEFFDKDGNGDISKREMRDRVLTVYRERRLLLNDLSDMSQVVGKLDMFLTAFALVIIIIISLMVFGLDALKTLATLGTMFVAWSFIFGGTFKNVFECIVFLFQVHPYDVGDTVVINGESLTVSTIRLLSTVFFKTDGTYTVYPNSVLATTKIQNLRRSQPQSESIPVAFSFDTPLDRIYALRDRMTAFMEDNPRDYAAPVGFGVDLLENANRVQVSVGINYKNNWQDGARRGAAKTRFAFELREAIRDLGLRYALPLQPVAMVQPPPGYDEDAGGPPGAPADARSARPDTARANDANDDDSIFGPERRPAPGAHPHAAGSGSGGHGGGGGGGHGDAGAATMAMPIAAAGMAADL